MSARQLPIFVLLGRRIRLPLAGIDVLAGLQAHVGRNRVALPSY